MRIAVAEEEAFLKTLTAGSRLFEAAADETRAERRHGDRRDVRVRAARHLRLPDRPHPGDGRRGRADRRHRGLPRADGTSRRPGPGPTPRPARPVSATCRSTGNCSTSAPTEFTGYAELETEGTIRGLIADGSRVGGRGRGRRSSRWCWTAPRCTRSPAARSPTPASSSAPAPSAEVLDVQKVNRKLWVHRVRITDGELREGETVLAKVDPEWRIGARQAHSGTHVVHAALRQVLGPEALQSGSYNKPGYLRLDFAWNSGLSAATRSRDRGGRQPRGARRPAGVGALHVAAARPGRRGALALFGETYDETVRVVEIGGPWSIELCGGTHVEHSSQIGPVSLIGESSVGSGVRRIEAYVGHRRVPPAGHRAGAGGRAGRPAEGAAGGGAGPGREPGGAAAGGGEGTGEGARGRRCSPRPARWSTGADRGERRRAGRRGRPGRGLGRRPADAGRRRPRPARRPAGGGGAVRSVPTARCRSWSATTAGRGRPAACKAGDLVKAFLPAIEGRGGGKPDLAQGGGTRPDGVPARHRHAARGRRRHGSVTAGRRGIAGLADPT